MYFSKAILLALPVSALAGLTPMVRRQFSVVLADLQTIDADINDLNTKAQAFSGTGSTASPVISAEQKLEKDLDTAANDCNSANTPVANDSQSQQIIDYVNNTLEPDEAACLATIKSKKAQFAAAGLTSLVKNNLNSIRTKTVTLNNCLQNKASTSKKSAAKAAGDKVIADIDDAIKYYS